MLLVMQQLIYEACLKCLWQYVWLHTYEKLLRVLLPGDLGAVPAQKQKWLGESTKGEREWIFPPPKWLGLVWSLHSIFCQITLVLTFDFGNKCLGKGMKESLIHKSPSQLRGCALRCIHLSASCRVAWYIPILPLENSRHEGETAEGFSSRTRGHSKSPSGVWFGDALTTPAAGRKGQPCSAGLLAQPCTPAAPLRLALSSSALLQAQTES